MLKIAIGADHRGFELKEFLMQQESLADKKIIWTNVGCFVPDRTDYPLFASPVSILVQTKQVDIGILICGTGTGMAVAANRFERIYAGVAWNEVIARLNKEDDNVNILVLPSDFVTPEQAIRI